MACILQEPNPLENAGLGSGWCLAELEKEWIGWPIDTNLVEIMPKGVPPPRGPKMIESCVWSNDSLNGLHVLA